MQTDPGREDVLADTVGGIPDAKVREVAELPERLPNSIVIGPYTEAAHQALLFGVPGIARVLVRGGTSVDVVVAPGADRAAVRMLLGGPARAALIQQRGELALSAASVVSPSGMCIAICGTSGSGKSSLAFSLCRRGWTLAADEITRVGWAGLAGVVWPTDARVKLWRDGCDAAQQNPAGLERVRAGIERYYVPVGAAASAMPLIAVVGLRIAPAVSLRELPPVQRAELITQSTFRSRQIDPLGCRASYDRLITQISGGCRVLILDGARERPIEELADSLSEAIQ